MGVKIKATGELKLNDSPGPCCRLTVGHPNFGNMKSFGVVLLSVLQMR